MGIELVTGFTGKAHISSLDVAKFNAGALGPGEYVFAGVKDDKLKATMASSNKVHISSGNAMMQGRHFWVDAAGVDLTVQTGTQGQKRNDLVVARYAKNASTGVESVSLVVIKGTPTTGTPADPSYTRGDILNGNALTNDMPLWRIPLNGITVGTPVQLFISTRTPHAGSDRNIMRKIYCLDQHIAPIDKQGTRNKRVRHLYVTLFGANLTYVICELRARTMVLQCQEPFSFVRWLRTYMLNLRLIFASKTVESQTIFLRIDQLDELALDTNHRRSIGNAFEH